MIRLFSGSKVIGISLTLLMLAASALVLGIQPVKIAHASRVITVPDDYAKIHDAVNNANDGDTIFVRAGTYYDSLWINKSLTIKGESNKNTTVILSTQSSYPLLAVGLWVTASNVTMSGFHFVINSEAGIVAGIVLIDGRSSIANDDVFMDNIIEDKPCAEGFYPDPLVAISSEGDRIVGNTILSNGNSYYEGGSGITLDGADNCLIAENNVTAGWAGIIIIGNHNIVAFNNIANQTDYERLQCGGITLENFPCGYNIVVGNTVVGNDYGVSCWRLSHDNVIYHNNFIHNVHQAYSESSLNSWDNGYPSGGNYWSDYNGNDLLKGEYQNVTGSDGVGDTPVVVNSNAVDRYPLMNPVAGIVGDVNLDGKVDVKDIAVAARSFGLTFKDLSWNQMADLNGDGRIDIVDLALIARNFGKSWL